MERSLKNHHGLIDPLTVPTTKKTMGTIIHIVGLASQDFVSWMSSTLPI
jgi:hypothetical protein